MATNQITVDHKKTISMLIENNVLLPMQSAVDTFNQLAELAKTIRDTASAPLDARSDHAKARIALMRIATLADVAAYLADDIGNFVDCQREDVAKEHKQAIIDAVCEGAIANKREEISI